MKKEKNIEKIHFRFFKYDISLFPKLFFRNFEISKIVRFLFLIALSYREFNSKNHYNGTFSSKYNTLENIRVINICRPTRAESPP